MNRDNLNNVRLEASRHFRNKKRECLNDDISGFATDSKYENIRGLHREINELKKGYHPRNNSVKDKNVIYFQDP
jgi:hypothetical protein